MFPKPPLPHPHISSRKGGRLYRVILFLANKWWQQWDKLYFEFLHFRKIIPSSQVWVAEVGSGTLCAECHNLKKKKKKVTFCLFCIHLVNQRVIKQETLALAWLFWQNYQLIRLFWLHPLNLFVCFVYMWAFLWWKIRMNIFGRATCGKLTMPMPCLNVWQRKWHQFSSPSLNLVPNIRIHTSNKTLWQHWYTYNRTTPSL